MESPVLPACGYFPWFFAAPPWQLQIPAGGFASDARWQKHGCGSALTAERLMGKSKVGYIQSMHLLLLQLELKANQGLYSNSFFAEDTSFFSVFFEFSARIILAAFITQFSPFVANQTSAVGCKRKHSEVLKSN